MRKAGDGERGELKGEEDIRDWNLRSNGRNDGVGLKREVDAREARPLLSGEDKIEP